ncbi:MAG TPA: SDR family NAD(P)-dependent oxidoreductase [Patescibacteria group bacterium]|nr:SDR family NAD(P)-dependent oxidoreductase [Patescibacteria group bacterium]
MSKIILVTGASSGLGKAIVTNLSSRGFTVYAGARDLSKLVKGKNIIPVMLDITIDDSCKKVVEKIIKKDGKIDILINVAGYSLSGPTLDFSSKDFSLILNTNVIGAFRLIKEVVPNMQKRKSGKIINITSMSGLIAFPNFGLYSASKFALEALGKSLGYELAKDHISVTNVAPGAIKSETEVKPLFKHKTAREKFKFLNFLMPMVTKEQISNKVLDIIKDPNPPPSVILGADTKIIYFIQKILPTALWNKLQYFVWNRK